MGFKIGSRLNRIESTDPQESAGQIETRSEHGASIGSEFLSLDFECSHEGAQYQNGIRLDHGDPFDFHLRIGEQVYLERNGPVSDFDRYRLSETRLASNQGFFCVHGLYFQWISGISLTEKHEHEDENTGISEP
jgi:hypothetical protein